MDMNTSRKPYRVLLSNRVIIWGLRICEIGFPQGPTCHSTCNKHFYCFSDSFLWYLMTSYSWKALIFLYFQENSNRIQFWIVFTNTRLLIDQIRIAEVFASFRELPNTPRRTLHLTPRIFYSTWVTNRQTSWVEGQIFKCLKLFGLIYLIEESLWNPKKTVNDIIIKWRITPCMR